MSVYIILSELLIIAALIASVLGLRHRMNEFLKISFDYTDKMQELMQELLKEQIFLIGKRVDACEKGITPDYDKAKEAANALNAFNDSISAILGYDPYKAIHAKGGENV